MDDDNMFDERTKKYVLIFIGFIILFIIGIVFTSLTNRKGQNLKSVLFDVSSTQEVEEAASQDSPDGDESVSSDTAIDSEQSSNSLTVADMPILYDKDTIETHVIKDKGVSNAVLVHFSDKGTVSYISASITAVDFFSNAEDSYPETLQEAKSILGDYDIPYDEFSNDWTETTGYYVRTLKGYSYDMKSSVISYTLVPKKAANNPHCYMVFFYYAENCPLSENVYNTVLSNLDAYDNGTFDTNKFIPTHNELSADLVKIFENKTADDSIHERNIVSFDN